MVKELLTQTLVNKIKAILNLVFINQNSQNIIYVPSSLDTSNKKIKFYVF